MAFEFTPPTYQAHYVPWARMSVEQRAKSHNRLYRFYDNTTAYSVLIAGGVASTYPGIQAPRQSDIDDADSGSGIGGKAAFLGGRTYTVTASEKTILENAGYTVTTV